jgi:peptidoglycan/LPS O-acetylase OafA/YrhL
MVLDLPVSFAAAAILVGASRLGRNRIRDLLSLKPLVVIGLFSYSLYVIHYPLADVLCQYLLAPMRLGQVASEGMLAAVVIPIIVASAYCFYWAFERPFHLIARRIGR